jgi:Fe-S-cluster containining protein
VNNAEIYVKKIMFMRCVRCGVCCTETEMLLSKKDIARLKKKGYPVDSFMRFDKDGYAILRNRNGYCVFYNVKQRQCDVYADRPLGCRIYPVILDEGKGIVVDHICHAKRSVTESEKIRKGKQVIKLLEVIDYEAKTNRSVKKAEK